MLEIWSGAFRLMCRRRCVTKIVVILLVHIICPPPHKYILTEAIVEAGMKRGPQALLMHPCIHHHYHPRPL
jgi:hypothetical protein